MDSKKSSNTDLQYETAHLGMLCLRFLSPAIGVAIIVIGFDAHNWIDEIWWTVALAGLALLSILHSFKYCCEFTRLLVEP